MAQPVSIIVAASEASTRQNILGMLQKMPLTAYPFEYATLEEALDAAFDVHIRISDQVLDPLSADFTCLVIDETALQAAEPATQERLHSLYGHIGIIGLVDGAGYDFKKSFDEFVSDILLWHKTTPDLLAQAIQHARSITALALRVERQRAEIERFSHILSHDLSAPISSLQRLLDFGLTLWKEGNPDNAKDVVERAQQAAKRVGNLLEGLERRASIEKATQRQTDALDKAAHIAVKRLENEAIAQGHALSAHIEIKPLPVIEHCPMQMAEMFKHLLSNALYYNTSSAPQVRVSGEYRNGAIEICVEDNGIGIDPDYLEHVFEPCARLQGPQEYPGAGMGLTVCRTVTTAMGGHIWAEPRLEGGTCIRVSLPAAC